MYQVTCPLFLFNSISTRFINSEQFSVKNPTRNNKHRYGPDKTETQWNETYEIDKPHNKIEAENFEPMFVNCLPGCLHSFPWAHALIDDQRDDQQIRDT